MDNKIILLQGCPANGKSTRAKEIYLSDPKKYVIISKDALREARGDYWVPEQEKYIYQIEEAEARIALKNGLTPIIDSTNLNPSDIEKWEKIAKEFEVELEKELIYVPLKIALERDSKRERRVTEKVIKAFYWKYFEKEYREEMYTDKTFMLKQNEDLPKAIIVDLDGTVAMHNGRGPFEWERIYTDVCDFRMKNIIESFEKSGVTVIFLTGRNKTEVAYKQTTEWLMNNFKFKFGLIMRDEKDFRSSDISKKDLYEKYIKDKYNVLCTFEDCIKCTKMWRELGLLCCAVADNEYQCNFGL